MRERGDSDSDGDSHVQESFTSGEIDAIQRLYDDSPECVDRPEGENNDLVLLAAGVRPAAEATIIVDENSVNSPRDVDPVIGFAQSFQLERRTFTRRRDGFACHSHYLARESDRFDRFRQDSGKLNRGGFLGYPPPAIEDNSRESEHVHRWYDYLDDRSVHPDHWEPLAVVPYVPECTEAGYIRALDRGRRYLAVLRRLEDTIPKIADEIEQNVAKLKSRVC